MDDARHLMDHIIVTGQSYFLSFDIRKYFTPSHTSAEKVSAVLKTKDGRLPIVVLFNEDLPPREQWERASKRAIVFMIRGSALKPNDLLRAGIDTARIFVVTALRDQASDVRSADTESIIAFLAVSHMRPAMDIRLEISAFWNTTKCVLS